MLGMNGDVQTPLSVVVLRTRGQEGETVPQEEPSAREMRESRELPSATARFAREMSQCIDLQTMMKASRLLSADELAPAEGVAAEMPEQGDAAESRLGRVSQSAESGWLELADVIKARSSGNDLIGLAATGRSIPCQKLSDMMEDLAAHPDARALAKEVGVFLAAHRVEGLTPGVYRCDLSARALHPLTQHVDAGRLMERASVVDGKFINFRSLPAAFYLTVDGERALQQHGNRGYQILLMKAGRLTHYLCLLAAARGWFARPLKSYRDEAALEMLGLAQTTENVVYQLVIGENKTPYLDFDMGL
jgi:hypothetical protein